VVLGIDAQGREVLPYIPGEVPDRPTPETMTERALEGLGRLLRRYHDAVSGFELPPGVEWHHRPRGKDEGAIVCHNDIAPKNTVFREGRPVAFLDWDLVSLAPAAWDLAHAAWQFVPLSDDAGCTKRGWPFPPNRPRRLRVLCDGYGLPEGDHVGFVALVAERMEATASGIERLAAEGVASYERLVRDGVPSAIRAERGWVERHAGELESHLLGDRG